MIKLYTLLNKNIGPNFGYAGIRYQLVYKNMEPLQIVLYEDKDYPLGTYMQNNKIDKDNKYRFAFNSLEFLKKTFTENNFKLFEALDIFVYEVCVPEDKVIEGYNQSLFENESIIEKKRIYR
jgi:hypothetical protein